MQVVVFVKAGADSEAGALPSEQLIRDMMAFNEELVNAGVMKDGAGLKATSHAKRIRFDGENKTIVDGPFAETKELVAGYWIWEVASMEEAMQWAMKCPNPQTGNELALEIRPVIGLEDFGDVVPQDMIDLQNDLESRTAAARN